jgi:4-amino-4-deoxy-L-arabinose transferase-like glycosyltransferase
LIDRRSRARVAPADARIRIAAAGERQAWLAVALITAVAAVLRLATIGLQSFDFDEGATLYVIRGSFVHMLHGVALHESTPPLYYVLAWAWTQLFGSGETALRLVSALAGIATVPVVYALGRAFGSRRLGLAAAAVAATSPYLVFYSQEARSYALFALLSTVAALRCVRTLRDPRPRSFTVWAIVSLAALATHYFAAFFFVGQAVALALFGAPRRLLVRAVVAVALLSTPLIVLARHQAAAGHASWIGSSPLLQRLRVTVETFALGATFKGTLPRAVLLLCAVLSLVIACALLAAGIALVRRSTASERRPAKLCGVIATVAVVLPFLGALGPADYFVHKNLIPVLPLLAIVVAAGATARRAARVGAAVVAALVVSGLALTAASFAVSDMRRPDIRFVSRELGPPVRERVLVFVPRWRILLQEYQGRLDDLPAAGRRVTEIDVFTADNSIPPGVVPSSFRLLRIARGEPFTVFMFRARSPLLMSPARLAGRTFSESGLQPIAVLQSPR